MKLSIVWWNTSLSPASRREGPTELAASVAASLTARFIDSLGADIVALSEVSSEDVSRLASLPEAKDFYVHDGASPAGKSRFDLCVLSRKEKLQQIRVTDLIVQRGNGVLKLGQHIDFAVAGSSKPLHLILSHWPSRLWVKEGDPVRSTLGMRMRDQIDRIQSAGNAGPIILAGDYNDEPFDASISEFLMATRDRSLAARRSNLLYNPFWKHLTHKTDATNVNSLPSHAGSYFHQGGHLTEWRTFDQMMFSADFISGGDWQLLEDQTMVIDIPDYTKLVRDRKQSFDHLPVIGVIERNTNG